MKSKNNDDMTIEQLEKKIDRLTSKKHPCFIQESILRRWKIKHGKHIDFDDDERKYMRSCFDDLDDDKGGAIGVEELEEPLLAFGLVDNRDEVINLMKNVDDDLEITFPEFLSLISGAKGDKGGNSSQNLIQHFFKDMYSGKYDKIMDKDLAFNLNVSQYRRKKILESMMGSTNEKKKKGIKIRKGFENWIKLNQRQKMIEGGVNPDDIDFDEFPEEDLNRGNRSGFQNYKRIMNHDKNLLIKPKTNQVQKLTIMTKI